jgi:hypothetical protein
MLVAGYGEFEFMVLERSRYRNLVGIGRTIYSRFAFDNEEGYRSAMETLEDSDLWEDSVANGRTRLGAEEYYERVLNSMGWEEVVGDVYSLGPDYEYNINLVGFGGRLDTKGMSTVLISPEALDYLQWASDVFGQWDNDNIPEPVIKKVEDIFDQFDISDENLVDLGIVII